jgi:DNA-directed RNA polymerase beta subunit
VTNPAPDLPEPPPGITLRDPEDSDSIRDDIDKSVLSAMQRYVNGYAYGGVRIELKNLQYVGPKKFTKAQQREALLDDKTLARRLRGTLRLVDDETNAVLDERKNFTLARVPYLTERGTFVDNGSEYAPVMQSRLLPGAYTRRRDNGELETHLNVRPGTGAAMRVSFDPQTAQYRIKLGSSDLHAYSVFKDLGVSDEELERRWGPDILEVNRAKYSRHTLDRLYKKAIPKWERDETRSPEDRVKDIRAALERAQVAESILKQNLPNLFSREKAASWRMNGRALDAADRMTKSAAAVPFDPDFTPEQIWGQWESFDVPLTKRAAFSPDFTPDELKESYNAIYGGKGPRLASMREWPEHWLDDTDKQGWLQWYEKYHTGRRGETDDKQIARWKSFKARTGAQFAAKPTPRRAFSLVNWGIDPLKLLPAKQVDDFKEEMEGYRRKEYVRWYMQRHDFDDAGRERLARLARGRGAETTDAPGPGELMTLALEGHIKPEDLQ